MFLQFLCYNINKNLFLLFEIFQCTLLISYDVLESIYNFLIQFIKPNYKLIQNEVVLITGAASGLGRLMCRKLAEKECVIIGVDINTEGLMETKRIILSETKNKNVTVYTCDIRYKENIVKLRKYVEEHIGHVDILINNAGVAHGKSLLNLTEEEIKETFDVNTLSNFYIVQEFLPSMLNQSHGHIVFVASIAGSVTCPQLSDYCASKAATIMLSETVLNELRFLHKNKDIHVTTVAPYFIKTGMFNGCSSKIKCLFPDLDPDYVADKIIKAIMKNQIYLSIGRLMYFIVLAKSILPVTGIHRLYKLSGANEFLKTFSNVREDTRRANYKKSKENI